MMLIEALMEIVLIKMATVPHLCLHIIKSFANTGRIFGEILRPAAA